MKHKSHTLNIGQWWHEKSIEDCSQVKRNLKPGSAFTSYVTLSSHLITLTGFLICIMVIRTLIVKDCHEDSMGEHK